MKENKRKRKEQKQNHPCTLGHALMGFIERGVLGYLAMNSCLYNESLNSFKHCCMVGESTLSI